MTYAGGSEVGFALVTGGTGALGPALVGALVASGWKVRVLSRNPPAAGVLPDTVEKALGDVCDPDSVRVAMTGTTHVFHLAGKLHINNPDPVLVSEYRQVNVDGTRIVRDVARAADVERLIYFSTIAVYGSSRPGEVLSEESPAPAPTLYSSTKREAEEIVLSLHDKGGKPAGVVLRLAAVYGRGVKGNYRQLVRLLHRGIFVPVGDGRNRRTLIHESDVADAALLAAVHPAAAGGIFNVTDGAIHTFSEVIAAICEALHRRPPTFSVPVGLARATAGMLDAAAGIIGRRNIASPLVEKMIEDIAVSGLRIQAQLGFRPRYDLRQGWQEAAGGTLDRGPASTGSRRRSVGIAAPPRRAG